MDFTDQLSNIYKVLLIPIKLIIPLRIEDLFKTLGLGIFFLIFLEYKKNKYLFFLILLFILSALILNNYQSRWFFPLLLITSIFLTETKFKVLGYLARCQFLFSLIILHLVLDNLTRSSINECPFFPYMFVARIIMYSLAFFFIYFSHKIFAIEYIL